MGQISDLTELTTPAGTEQVVVRTTDATDKDKKLPLSKMGVLNLAQSWSAVQTFTNGINLGNENLTVYDEGTWTPSDASGAGLSFTANGRYTRIGRMVFAEASVQFPATADTSEVIISGLPFTGAVLAGATRGGGFWMNQNTGVTCNPHVRSAGVYFVTTAGNGVTNNQCSGKLLRFAVIYTV